MRQVSIDAALTLWDDQNITALNQRCQDLLRARFAELMPEHATAVKIDLRVHRLNHPRKDGSRRITAINDKENKVRRRTEGAARLPQG